jgi:hypothetical protein
MWSAAKIVDRKWVSFFPTFAPEANVLTLYLRDTTLTKLPSSSGRLLISSTIESLSKFGYRFE